MGTMERLASKRAFVLSIFLALLLSSLCLSSSVSLSNDSEIRAWADAVPKETGWATLLAGECTRHAEAIRGVYHSYPTYTVTGGPGSFERLIKHFREICGVTSICPSHIVLITQCDTISPFEMKEITRSMIMTRMCSTPDFGGLNVDCSRVWVVLSTCVGSDVLGGDTDDLEGFSMTKQQIDNEIWLTLKRKWSGANLNHAWLRVIETYHTREADVDKLARSVFAKLQHERMTEGKASSKSIDMVTERSLDGFIDLNVFDRSGFSGQDWARDAAKKALSAVQRGLKLSSSPLVFLFLGPAGTGKTMLSQIIASAYLGGGTYNELAAANLSAIFTMSEYTNDRDIDSLVSPPAGLQGKGSLISLFQSTPRPVIILDELEKGHPKLISTMLLPWLNENGFVQDKKEMSNRFPTKDAIFILTSNCFADEISAFARQYDNDAQKVSDEVVHLLNKHKDRQYARDDEMAGCAALSKDYVIRRMQAGHALSDLSRYGFIVFLPPTQKQIDDIVGWFLESYNKQYKGRFLWTKRAYNHLRDMARKESSRSNKSGGLSFVNSALVAAVTRVLLMSECERPGNLTSYLLYEKNAILKVKTLDCAIDTKTVSHKTARPVTDTTSPRSGGTSGVHKSVSDRDDAQAEDLAMEVLPETQEAIKVIAQEQSWYDFRLTKSLYLDKILVFEKDHWFLYTLSSFALTLAMIFAVAFAAKLLPFLAMNTLMMIFWAIPFVLLVLYIYFPWLFWFLVHVTMRLVEFWGFMIKIFGFWGTIFLTMLLLTFPRQGWALLKGLILLLVRERNTTIAVFMILGGYMWYTSPDKLWYTVESLSGSLRGMADDALHAING